MIKILQLKASDFEARVVTKGDDYKTSQELVGGYIERLMIDDEIDLWLNEEGKLNGLQPNFNLVRNDKVIDVVVGDVFFASHDDEGNTTSLTEEMISRIQKRFQDRRNMIWG
jgi:hypothetical protein